MDGESGGAPLKALCRSMASWRGLGGIGGKVRLAIAGDRCALPPGDSIRFGSGWRIISDNSWMRFGERAAELKKGGAGWLWVDRV
jgi:hypothetical protein